MYIASNGIKTAVILTDPEPISPREEDNLGTMICWHRRYNLGDVHNFDDSQEFAERLANDHLNIQDVFSAVHAGKVDNLRLKEIEIDKMNGEIIGPHYILQELSGIPRLEEWKNTGWRCTKDLEFITAGGESLEDLFFSCTTDQLLQLVEASNKVAILPLYLYDHTGRSISTTSFEGRAPHAGWDSGHVGYIWMDKDTAMRELSIAGNKVRLAQPILDQMPFRVQSAAGGTLEQVMADNGYQLVCKEDILNLDEKKLIHEHWHANGLFKKAHKIYAVDDHLPDGSFNIRPVATFNPDLLPLTDENWKDRAFEVLEGEVGNYDNYLKGEIYGYELYDGFALDESVWGFNPGREDIQSLMKEELGSWFGPGLEFKYEFDDHFDIEHYYESHDFPQLREKLKDEVDSLLTFQESTSLVYPFAMSAADIMANKNNVLTEIVAELYASHEDHDSDSIYSSIESHAGISRDLMPKLSIKDLEPDREYTADELMGILKKKPSLADMIIDAQSRAAGKGSAHNAKAHEQNR